MKLRQNCAKLESYPSIDSEPETNRTLICLLRSLSSRSSETYYWRLFGDTKDSLNKLLRIKKDEMIEILVKCKLYSTETGDIVQSRVMELGKKLAFRSPFIQYTNALLDFVS